MPRRIHVPVVQVGEVTLTDREAHHLRDVLRLTAGASVEVFDDEGNIGTATLTVVEDSHVNVRVEVVQPAPEAAALRFRIASAVPKAGRGDWLVEKISELGAEAFIPLATARSVVLPEGKNKIERWQRLAGESAKQSRRRGVMRIEGLTPLGAAIAAATAAGEAWVLSMGPGARPVREAVRDSRAGLLTIFIGPEGGWSGEELELFQQARVPAIALSATILRVETAAVAAAALAGCLFNGGLSP